MADDLIKKLQYNTNDADSDWYNEDSVIVNKTQQHVTLYTKNKYSNRNIKLNLKFDESKLSKGSLSLNNPDITTPKVTIEPEMKNGRLVVNEINNGFSVSLSPSVQKGSIEYGANATHGWYADDILETNNIEINSDYEIKDIVLPKLFVQTDYETIYTYENVSSAEVETNNTAAEYSPSNKYPSLRLQRYSDSFSIMSPAGGWQKEGTVFTQPSTILNPTYVNIKGVKVEKGKQFDIQTPSATFHFRVDNDGNTIIT